MSVILPAVLAIILQSLFGFSQNPPVVTQESVTFHLVPLPTSIERFTVDPFVKQSYTVYVQLLALNDPRIDQLFTDAHLVIKDAKGTFLFPRP